MLHAFYVVTFINEVDNEQMLGRHNDGSVGRYVGGRVGM
jgi:hypothetical protein